MMRRFLLGLVVASSLAFALACLSPWWAELPGMRDWWRAHR